MSARDLREPAGQVRTDELIDRGWEIKEWSGGSGIGGPERAANALRHHPGFVWLDSAMTHPARGRWSILAAAPRWTLSAKGSRLRLNSAEGGTQSEGDPIAVATQLIEAEQMGFPARPASRHTPNLPFAGGAIGYFGFELARHIESLPATTIDDVGAADLVISWYDAALVLDRLNQKGWLGGTPEAIAELSERLAGTSVWSNCASELGNNQRSRSGPTRFESNMERSEYFEQIAAARRYIEAGDIYQVNLSQRFCAPMTISGFEAYLRLRRISPASLCRVHLHDRRGRKIIGGALVIARTAVVNRRSTSGNATNQRNSAAWDAMLLKMLSWLKNCESAPRMLQSTR